MLQHALFSSPSSSRARTRSLSLPLTPARPSAHPPQAVLAKIDVLRELKPKEKHHCCSQFMVHKTAVLKHPKSLYLELKDLCVACGPWSGWGAFRFRRSGWRPLRLRRALCRTYFDSSFVRQMLSQRWFVGMARKCRRVETAA